MDLTGKIDETNGIGRERFEREYLVQQRPLVIRNMALGTIAEQKWSLNYFKSKMGDLKVGLIDNNNKKSASSAYTRPDVTMLFGDYIDLLASDSNTGLRMFLANLFKHRPSLRDEYPCPEIFHGILDHMGLMFFGGRNSKVRIHYDIDMSNVLHTHFGGRKRVVLISPEYSKQLYCLPLNTYSLVDIDAPDYDQYPALKGVRGSEVILNHGDAVYMPEGYWHLMTYLDPSFSVSYRKLPLNAGNKLRGLLNLGVYMPSDKIMNTVLGQRWLEIKRRKAHSRVAEII